MTALDNKVYFHGPHQPQIWSLPYFVITYICKNPSSPKGYQKIIKSCKYFFAKNPIIFFERIHFSYDHKCTIALKELDLTKLLNKRIWITEEFANACCKDDIINLNYFSSILPHFYRVDAQKVYISNQNLTFTEFLFLTSKVKDLQLNNINVTNENGSIVSLENLVESLPNTKKIIFRNNASFTKNTIQKLFQIPHFSKIDEFKLFDVPESFDIETFFAYLKKNNHTKFFLYYNGLSEAYKNRIEAIIDEILATKNPEYKVPCLNFYGLSDEKRQSLWRVSIRRLYYSFQNYGPFK